MFNTYTYTPRFDTENAWKSYIPLDARARTVTLEELWTLPRKEYELNICPSVSEEESESGYQLSTTSDGGSAASWSDGFFSEDSTTPETTLSSEETVVDEEKPRHWQGDVPSSPGHVRALSLDSEESDNGYCADESDTDSETSEEDGADFDGEEEAYSDEEEEAYSDEEDEVYSDEEDEADSDASDEDETSSGSEVELDELVPVMNGLQLSTPAPVVLAATTPGVRDSLLPPRVPMGPLGSNGALRPWRGTGGRSRVDPGLLTVSGNAVNPAEYGPLQNPHVWSAEYWEVNAPVYNDLRVRRNDFI